MTIYTNVMDYGATGNGTTDDTAAIDSAIAAAGVGIVYFPAGVYLVSSTIQVPNHVTLMGVGGRDVTWGSRIFQANGANLDAVVADVNWSTNAAYGTTGASVVGMIIDGNAANQTAGKGIGICFMVYRGTIRETVVANTYGDGIRWTDVSANGTEITYSVSESVVRENIVYNCGAGNQANNTSGIAVREGSVGAKVTDCFIEDNEVYSIPNGSGLYLDNAYGDVIEGNHVWGIGLHGYMIKNSGGTRIRGNYAEYFGELAGQVNVYGIWTRDNGTGLGTVVEGNHVNCVQPVTGNTFVGISLNNPGNGAAYYALGPNTIYTTGSTGGTAVQTVNNGNQANFVLAMAAQSVTGFASPYQINQYLTLRGDPFRGLQKVPFASTLSVDPTLGTVIEIGTLTGNLTMDIPAQLPSGLRFTFIFKQDGTGGRHVTWANNNNTLGQWVNATFAPATAANSWSSVSFVSDGYDLIQGG